MSMWTHVEVEKIPTQGMATLYVESLEDPVDIISRAKMRGCPAIRFGANRSFDDVDGSEVDYEIWEAWEPWVEMIQTVLEDSNNFLCLLEFDSQYCESFLDTGLAEHNRMIPVISVKLPYHNQLGYNAIIKIDDIENNRTNDGIWCHTLHELKHPKAFTRWNEYMVWPKRLT